MNEEQYKKSIADPDHCVGCNITFKEETAEDRGIKHLNGFCYACYIKDAKETIKGYDNWHLINLANNCRTNLRDEKFLKTEHKGDVLSFRLSLLAWDLELAERGII